jgi:beta-N-acetylhexosaminidase
VLGPPLDVGIAGATGEGRALGDDPRTVARRARAALRRLAKAGTLAAPGHLPGQGTASGDPDAQTATVGLSLDELRARDLVPFRALAPRVPALQLSNAVYAAYDGVTPATLLPQVARTLARGELGFRGALVSGNLGSAADVLGISEARAAVEALQAGDDLLLVPDRGAGPAAHAAIVSAVKAHKLSRRRLDEACSRVLALKRRAKIVR